MTEEFVVYLDGDGEYLETHGGPYHPRSATAIRKAMDNHISRGTRAWSIPDDAEEVVTATRDELREIKGLDMVQVEMPRATWNVVIHTLEEEMDQLAPVEDDAWIGERPEDEAAGAVGRAHETIMEALTDD